MPDLDHRFIYPPHLRVVKEFTTGSGDKIYRWDLRIAQPNVSAVDPAAMHSLEHFPGSYFDQQEYGGNRAVVNVAPMGCLTGIYLVTVDIGTYADMAACLEAALQTIGHAHAVPLADEVACGKAVGHSLVGATDVADWLLRRKAEWSDLGPDAREV